MISLRDFNFALIKIKTKTFMNCISRGRYYPIIYYTFVEDTVQDESREVIFFLSVTHWPVNAITRFYINGYSR